MKLQAFISLIAKQEGKKSQVKIGDLREICKLINWKTGGEFYKMIRKLK